MNKCVPITLITGYLGSGKTTLLNNLLRNSNNYKIAVIVNDIGEVNIDAQLIEKGGIVNKKEESLVALSNGCICCTLKKDLIEQIAEIIKQNKFDHIVIEASGICEPIPIAQTLEFLHDNLLELFHKEVCKLDAVVSVVDAIRMAKEFGCGETLDKDKVDEEDIENLIIQQVEFCDILVLNKVSDVSKDDLNKVKAVIKKLQPSAKIIETDYSNVDLSEILDTKLFDFDKALSSAGWIQELEKDDDDDDDDEHDYEHHDHEEHHHDHHHDHEHGETEEYGIGTYVYCRRRPFDRLKFDDFCAMDFGRQIIRTKGLVYFSDNTDMAYLYEQAGTSKSLTEHGEWYAVMLTQEEIDEFLATDELFKKDWDPEYGDRMIRLVFIGQHLDKAKIKELLDQA